MKMKAMLMASVVAVSSWVMPVEAQTKTYGCWGGVPNANWWDGETSLTVNLRSYGKTDRYIGWNGGDGIVLYGSECATGTSQQRQGWTWRNGEYSYTIYWRPDDPHYARLVIKKGSTEILNRILYRTY